MPLEDGRLLSPDNPGLSVVLIPGFSLGELAGAQVQLLSFAAGGMAMAFLLSGKLTGQQKFRRLATLLVVLAATPFIYSTEIFPELPTALALVACLLGMTVRRRLTLFDGVPAVVGLSALCRLGVKYVPLVGLVTGYFIWRVDRRGRITFLLVGKISAAICIWFRLAVYERLTPYNVNVVYAGMNSVELAAKQVRRGDRVYRLWGLFVGRRFGIGRWAPVFLVVVPGPAFLSLDYGRHRVVLGLVVIQILIATLVAITMMGRWFPGRTLMTVMPLLVISNTLVG